MPVKKRAAIARSPFFALFSELRENFIAATSRNAIIKM